MRSRFLPPIKVWDVDWIFRGSIEALAHDRLLDDVEHQVERDGSILGSTNIRKPFQEWQAQTLPVDRQEFFIVRVGRMFGIWRRGGRVTRSGLTFDQAVAMLKGKKPEWETRLKPRGGWQ